MTARLRIAVTGLAATFPYGGVFWDYLQYPLGLHRLGHDVLYVEDTGRWCYDPAEATFVESGRSGAMLLASRIRRLEPALAQRWYVRDATGATYGCDREQVTDFCRTADLFLHVSGSCLMREEYFAARRVVFVDSDPMYTQASLPGYLAGTATPDERDRVEILLRHDVHFTFAENIGAPDCLVPTGPLPWRPTRQPVVLDLFTGARIPPHARVRELRTAGSWEPDGVPPVIDGTTYRGKSSELERFVDLPARSALPLHLALSGPAPREHLADHGWALDDATALTGDPWDYRSYFAAALGEWSVAKHAYVASRSGWFSCRSACCLALGVPVIVQDTGFDLPAGEGVLPFSTLDEAVDAIDRLVSDPRTHAAAAVDTARHFDSAQVLGQLLSEALDHTSKEH